jgi:hypothetical protein
MAQTIGVTHLLVEVDRRDHQQRGNGHIVHLRYPHDERGHRAQRQHEAQRVGDENSVVEGFELALPKEQQPAEEHRQRDQQPSVFIGVGLHLVEQQLRVLEGPRRRSAEAFIATERDAHPVAAHAVIGLVGIKFLGVSEDLGFGFGEFFFYVHRHRCASAAHLRHGPTKYREGQEDAKQKQRRRRHELGAIAMHVAPRQMPRFPRQQRQRAPDLAVEVH